MHRAFCRAQSFVLAAFATLVCQRNCVFLCKGTKLQKAALFAIVCRFTAFAPGNSCLSNSPVQKLKNSAKQNSWTVRRFSLWNVFSFMEPAVWGFGLGLLRSQSFLGAKASLDPLCRFFVAQRQTTVKKIGGFLSKNIFCLIPTVSII